MSNQSHFLEITSQRRDRNSWKHPSDFNAPISQSGQKTYYDALDPVCLAAPIVQWYGYNFNAINGANNPEILIADIEALTLPSIGETTGTIILIIETKTSASTRGALQQADDYYRGAIALFTGSTPPQRRRILDYKYLGDDRAQIEVLGAFTTVVTPGTTALTIIDATDCNAGASNNYHYPMFFVPTSPSGTNYYVDCRIYNQTRCQSRPVSHFDGTTHMLSVDTSGARIQGSMEGPVGISGGGGNTWQEYDQYSIRRQAPIVCIRTVSGVYPFYTGLSNDTANSKETFTSWNVSTAWADQIAPSLRQTSIINGAPRSALAGSFLEVQQNEDLLPTAAVTLVLGAFGAIADGLVSVVLDTQVGPPVRSSTIDDYYVGAQIRIRSGAAAGQVSTIVKYVGASFLALLSPGFSNAAVATDGYTLVIPQESRRISKYVDYRGSNAVAIGGSTTTINFPINNTSINDPFYFNDYYTNVFITITSGAATGDIRKITSYIVTRNGVGAVLSAIATIDPFGGAFSGVIANTDTFTITSGVCSEPFTYSLSNQPAYLLQFSYDNLFPFVNTQLLNTQSLPHQFEIELINLILPNQILDTGYGSYISFYQYVYVLIENVGAGTNSANVIMSNNPKAQGMTFRCTIDDVPNPVNSTFIKIDGDGMTQIVRIDPSKDIRMSVYLSTGVTPPTSSDKQIRGAGGDEGLVPFRTVIKELYSPAQPNPLVQISAMFRLRRLTAPDATDRPGNGLSITKSLGNFNLNNR